MNHIYRIVFNAAIGQRQVVHEQARGGGGGPAPQGSAARVLAWCMAACMCTAAMADGGGGGGQTYAPYFDSYPGAAGGDHSTISGQQSPDYYRGGGGGGVSFATGQGGRGAAPVPVPAYDPDLNPGDNGIRYGAGGVGGDAGNFGQVSGPGVITQPVVGGSGLNGGNGGTGSIAGAGSGGGGGEGGGGILLNPNGQALDIQANVSGGNGGRGGNSSSDKAYVAGADGGGGGDGGSGVVIVQSGNVNIEAGVVVRAGTGGAGGSERNPQNQFSGWGGQGGDGGTGLLFLQDRAAIVNAGQILGGDAGAAGAGGTANFTPTVRTFGAGAAGAGISGSNLRITNSGVISGGLEADGTRATAIRFTDGFVNILDLHAPSVIHGAIEIQAGRVVVTALEAGAGLTDGLILGGEAVFNSDGPAMTIGGTISGTGSVGKAGVGTVTLGPNNTYSGVTRIVGGTLVGDSTSFGSSPTIDVAPPEATVQVNEANAGDFTAVVLGQGNFAKGGEGTLRLTGANTYTGNTIVLGGTLVGTQTSLGQGAVQIDSGARLRFEDSGAATFARTLSGAGSFEAAVGGVLVLSGVNTHTGGSNFLAPVVQASALSLGAGTVTLNDTALEINEASPFVNLGGAILGTGSLAKTGAGTVRLAQGTNFIGNTTIGAGRLVVAANAVGSGTVTNNAELQIDQVQDGSLANQITGPGTVYKTGAGNVTLTGANDIRQLQVSAGTVSIGSMGNLGSSVDTVLNGGTLRNTQAMAFDRDITLGVLGGTIDTAAQMILTGNLLQGANPGRLTKNGNGLLLLQSTGSNYTGGTQINAGTLQGEAAALGSGAIGIGNGAILHLDQVNAGTLAQDVSGAGLLVKSGAGNLSLTGNNSYTGGTVISGGVLNVSSDANLGQASGGLTFDGGTLRNTSAMSTARAITVTAAGGTVDTAAALTLSGSIDGAGPIAKTGNGSLRLSGANGFTGPFFHQSGTLMVDSDTQLGAQASVLHLANNAKLQGMGPLAIDRAIVLDAGGGSFESALDVPMTLGGVVSGVGGLTHAGAGTLTLSGLNTYTGGTTIDDGTVIGSVGSFGSGTINNSGVLDIRQGVDGTLANPLRGNGDLYKTGAGELTLPPGAQFFGLELHQGTLSISSEDGLGNPGSRPFIDDGATLRNTAPLALGSGRTISIAGDATFQTDADLVMDARIQTDQQGRLVKTGQATLVMNSPFNTFRGTRVDAGRLVGKVGTLGTGDIETNAILELRQDDAATLTQAIGGTGQVIKSGAGRLVMGAAHSYRGGTTITGGGVLAVASNANLGDPNGPLALRGGTLQVSSPMAMHRSIDVQGTGNVLLTDGDLRSEGAISGSGSLTKTGAATLTLTSASSFDGGTVLKQGRIDIGHSRSLGGGVLAMDDGTTLGIAGQGVVLANDIRFTGAADPTIDTAGFDATLAGAITGAADLSKTGAGTLTVTGANTYSGATRVVAGALKAGAVNAFSAASAHQVDAGATLDLAGFSQGVAALTNSGTVNLAGAVPGTTLTVNGAYVGNGGSLRLATALGDSSSASDRLVLDGPAAAASGRTTVQVLNVGGLGGLTSGSGIELISAVNGATTTAQTTKDAFALANSHVDAGAYEYRLVAADAQGAGENWYLRSTSTARVPVPSPLPSVVVPSVELPTYRAEVPLFAALPEQMRSSQRTMLATLHQRIGDDPTRSAATTDASPPGERRAWGRLLNSERDIRQGGTVTPHSKGRLTGFQGGTDLWVDGGWRAGVYAGQLDGDFGVDGFARGTYGGKVGSSMLRSQYLGGYATWTGASGLYVDTVLQSANHRFELKPDGNGAVKGKASGLAASVEVGMPFAIAEGWSIEPQAQWVHERLRIEDSSLGGTTVGIDDLSSLRARLGVRVRGDFATSAGRLQPYARVDVWRGKTGSDTARFSTLAAATAISSSAGGSSTEAAVGATLTINTSTSLYGEIGKSWASSGETRSKSSIQGSVGLRLRW